MIHPRQLPTPAEVARIRAQHRAQQEQRAQSRVELLPTAAAATAAEGGVRRRYMPVEPRRDHRQQHHQQLQQQQQQQQSGSSSVPSTSPPASDHALLCNTCCKGPSKPGQSSSSSSSSHASLARCSGCRAVYYCSRLCQRNDWNRHKWLCRHVRAMDLHRLRFIKVASTIPGNFHRPMPVPAISAVPPAVDLEMPATSEADAAGTASAATAASTAAAAASAAAASTPAAAASIDLYRVRSKRARSTNRPASTAPASAASAVFDYPDALPPSAPPLVDAMSDLVEAGSSGSEACSGSDSSADEAVGDELTGERVGKRKKRHSSHEHKHDDSSAGHHASSSSSRKRDKSLRSPDPSAPPLPPPAPLVLQPLVLPQSVSLDSDPLDLSVARVDEDSIQATYGDRPIDGALCLLFYQGRHANGSVFARNRSVFFNANQSVASSASNLAPTAIEWIRELDGATPLQFTLGIGEVLACWDECIRTMFRGETATILTRDDNRAVFVYELQLVDFTNP